MLSNNLGHEKRLMKCSELPCNCSGTIESINVSDAELSRLEACGIHCGQEVQMVRRGPFGGAMELAILNTHLALQQVVLDNITVAV